MTLDWHLRLLFWEGLKPVIKDKARHKKEECNTFSKLVSATRYGEREVGSAPIPKQVARVQQVTLEYEKPPKWASKFCAAMVREVKSAFASKSAPLAKPQPPRQQRGESQGDKYFPLHTLGVA